MPHTLCLGEDIVGLQSDHWQLSMLPAQSPSPSLATLAVTPTCKQVNFLFAVVRGVLARYAQGTTGPLDFAGPPPSDGNFCGGYAACCACVDGGGLVQDLLKLQCYWLNL